MKEYTYAEKSKLLIDETIDALRNKPIQSTYLEKLQLEAAVDRIYTNSGLPQPLVMGYGMNYMLENCSCPVEPHDILVGRFVECIPTEEEEAWLQAWRTFCEQQMHYCDAVRDAMKEIPQGDACAQIFAHYVLLHDVTTQSQKYPEDSHYT